MRALTNSCSWLCCLMLLLTTAQRCSYVAPAYLRNRAAQPVIVRIVGYAGSPKPAPYYLRYAKAVLPPRHLTPRHLTDSLRTSTDSSTVSFTLPPHATVCLGAFPSGMSTLRALVIERPGQPAWQLDSAAVARQFVLHYRLGGFRGYLDLP